MSVKPVYEQSKEAASKNLQIKISVLKAFVTDGIPWKETADGELVREPKSGARILDFYPDSETTFAKWTLADGKNPEYQNCAAVKRKIENKHGYFTSHGRDSLKMRKNERVLVISLLDSLRTCAKEQLFRELKVDREAAYKSEIAHLQAAAEAQAAFVLRALEEKTSIEKRARDAERALSETKLTVADLIKRKDAEIASRDLEISELKKKLSEVSRFHRV